MHEPAAGGVCEPRQSKIGEVYSFTNDFYGQIRRDI